MWLGEKRKCSAIVVVSPMYCKQQRFSSREEGMGSMSVRNVGTRSGKNQKGVGDGD